MSDMTNNPAPDDIPVEDVEAVALALWREDAARAAPNVLKNRTLEAFRSEINDTDRAVWEGFACAAITAYRQRQSGGGDEIVERCAALAERLEASDEYALGDGPTIATEIRKLKGAKPIALPRAPARPLSGEVREAVARIVEDAIARHDVSRAYHEGTLDDADAILSILALTRVTDRAGELDEIHAYLLGEGQLQGCWFGEPAPKGRRGAYWWRTNLRAAIQTGGEKR